VKQTTNRSTASMEDENAGTDEFRALGLDDRLVEALSSLGYEEPTPIQREAIPYLLANRDLLGQAATGTGKTAAFALPLLQRLAQSGRGRTPFALVLVPTRELAMQVAEAAHRYGRRLGVRVLPVYGGQPIGRQLRGLESGVDLVVATPGRALDLMRRKALDLGGVGTVVLDEADEMLDMGFAEDIEAILSEAPAERQTVLFSATMPPRIEAIARRHLRDPARVQIARESDLAGETPLISQSAYVVPRAHKLAALGRVLDLEGAVSAIVFCRTRIEVDELTESLSGRGYRAEALHGGMAQEQRDRVMKRFRGGTTELLIATDVAARGLDVEHLTHVINYDVPSAPEAYVHRIGRVGRAGREGVAITLVEPREHRLVRNIERMTKQKIDMRQVPTVADLRARRLALTQAALRESLLADDAEQYRVVVESLADEFDLVEIAMAAVRLAQLATGETEEQEIPQVRLHEDRPGRDARGSRDQPGARQPRSAAGREGGGRPAAGMARLFVGAGRGAGIRPQDLVGAIANEAGVRGRDIGAIQVADKFSIVEVPEEQADDIIAALRGSTIKGKKVPIRHDHGGRR
jgi:ATP-dependent RNA helicase DeaD